MLSIQPVWRNWIARWTSNPKVTGSSPVIGKNMGDCQGKHQENKEAVNATLVNQHSSIEIQVVRMKVGTLTEALKELIKAEKIDLITPEEHCNARTKLMSAFASVDS